MPTYEEDTELDILVRLAAVGHEDEWMGHIGVPFMPLYKLPDGRWRYWCPRLGVDGRCTNYENRPKLCRLYQPKSDFLCTEYDGVPPVETSQAV